MSIRYGFDDYSEIHGNKLYDASFKRVRKRRFIHTVPVSGTKTERQ